ncbi:hypothetical protein HK098_004023 [Nowakowskiella sp. JEL0407]|nr:hypothetical protein HK098_004023 [Nowakowskiella sp. JEL0407]
MSDITKLEIPHTSNPKSSRALPTEVLEKIFSFLLPNHAHSFIDSPRDPCTPTDLLNVCLANKHFLHLAIHLLWNSPRIQIGISQNAWKDFLSQIGKQNYDYRENGIQRSPFSFKYANMIKCVEDIWLHVTGDEVSETPADPDSESSADEAIIPELNRTDSKLDDDEIDSPFPKYSLPYALSAIMTNCTLSVLRLHFHHPDFHLFPWEQCLQTLKTLELGMQVSDSTIKQIFSKTLLNNTEKITVKPNQIGDLKISPSLSHIILPHANVTDESLDLISVCCPALTKISMSFVRPSKITTCLNARYQTQSSISIYNPSTWSTENLKQPSDRGLKRLLTIPNMTRIYPDIHIREIEILELKNMLLISNDMINSMLLNSCASTNLRMLCLTLNSSREITVNPFLLYKLLPKLSNLELLHLTAPGYGWSAEYTILGNLRDHVLDEEEIYMIPNQVGGESTKFKRLVLEGFEVKKKNEFGGEGHFGVSVSSWLLDEMIRNFKKKWEMVTLVFK